MLAEKIREAVESSGCTRNDLARRAGMNAPTLYRFLSGERDLTLCLADKLCRVLGLVLVPVSTPETDLLAMKFQLLIEEAECMIHPTKKTKKKPKKK